MYAVCNMLSKQALDRLLHQGASAARVFLHSALVDIMRGCHASGSVCDNLAQLPLLSFALQVCVCVAHANTERKVPMHASAPIPLCVATMCMPRGTCYFTAPWALATTSDGLL